jgi:hypothetical protein
MFVASSKVHKLIEMVSKEETRQISREAKGQYKKGDYLIRQPLHPRPLDGDAISFEERVRRMKVRDRFVEILPNLDCGLCGCPSCLTFAEDVSSGKANSEDCVLLSRDRVKKLRGIYGVGRRPRVSDGWET